MIMKCKKTIIPTIIFFIMTTVVIFVSDLSIDINHILTGVGYDYSYIQGNINAVPFSTEITVNGTIERNLFGKYEFIGTIKIEDEVFETPVDLKSKTPILSYYDGSRLVSSAYILAHSNHLDKLTIILSQTEYEPRRIIFCNMTYQEALNLQKVNELPELMFFRHSKIFTER